jgi:hypothetical protein
VACRRYARHVPIAKLAMPDSEVKATGRDERAFDPGIDLAELANDMC